MAEALKEAGAMSWRDFSSAIEQAYGHQGYAVTRLNSTAADFHLLKGGRTTLVSCKRWKAAIHGTWALRDLVAAKEAQGAHQSTYISLGKVTDNARQFAQKQDIHLISENDLAQLLSDKNRPQPLPSMRK